MNSYCLADEPSSRLLVDLQFAQAFQVMNPAVADVQIYFPGERNIVPIRKDQTFYDSGVVSSGHKTGMVDTVPALGDAVIDID